MDIDQNQNQIILNEKLFSIIDLPFTCPEEVVIKEILELIDKGADFDAKNDYHGTPLMAATLHGHSQITHLLIKLGADINAKSENGMTPLMFSVVNDKVEVHIVQLLIEYDANVNEKDNNGLTALMHAVQQKDKTCLVQLLLYHGSEINAESNYQNTALTFACRLKDNRDTVQLLLKNGAKVNQVNISGETPLRVAAIAGSHDMVQLLLNHGADVNLTNNDGETPLTGAFKAYAEYNTIRCFFNLMSNEELKAFSVMHESRGRSNVWDFKRILDKNHRTLNDKMSQKIVIHKGEKPGFECLQYFPEIINRIHMLQVLLEAPNNDKFAPWYSMSSRIQKDADDFLSRNPKKASIVFAPPSIGQAAVNVLCNTATFAYSCLTYFPSFSFNPLKRERTTEDSNQANIENTKRQKPN